MMTPQKKIANKILETLDSTAQQLDKLVKMKKIDPRVAASITRDLDTFADKFEVAAFGIDSFNNRRAKVYQMDADEKYMHTFDNPNKPLKVDADESYMHKVGPSFASKGIGTYDVDRSSTVTDRDEYSIRDLSEYSSQTKQPSWARGPAGKSTKQGSTVPQRTKTWAP